MLNIVNNCNIINSVKNIQETSSKFKIPSRIFLSRFISLTKNQQGRQSKLVVFSVLQFLVCVFFKTLIT